MLKTLFLLAVSGALAAPAPAAAGQEPAPPQWLRRPVITFPLLPEALGLEGRVALHCNVDPDAGSLNGCRAVSETPAELGFAEAAVAGARRARVAVSPAPDGAPGRSIGFTLRFGIGDEPGAGRPPVAGRVPAARDLARSTALLTERPLPENLFIPANGVPERGRAVHAQVLREFDRPAREVWALVLARSRDRNEHARVLNAGPGSWAAHQSELQTWSFAHPEAKALQGAMVDRMRALVCAEIVCEP